MKKLLVIIGVAGWIAVCVAFRKGVEKNPIGTGFCIQYYKQGSIEFASELQKLQQVISSMTVDSNSIAAARQQLIICRKAYKKIEFFSEYFLENRIKIFNQAPVYEIEEPYMEYQHPVGMQAMEGILFDEDAYQQKDELQAQAEVMQTTANGLMQYLYGKQINDADILEAMRLELIRIYTLGITGYDAPECKTGITEAYVSLGSLQQNLQAYIHASKRPLGDSVNFFMQRCLDMLSVHTTFDSFDRLSFYTAAALPLQDQLGLLIKDLQLEKQDAHMLNYGAPNIFSKGSINKVYQDGDTVINPQMIALGKKLFSETTLSGNNLRSCATCHNPAEYFTDGQTTSIAFNGKSRIQRNAPSLLYAAYQHNQFLDGRAADLPTQMIAVLSSPKEMNANPASVIKRLLKNPAYKKSFKLSFPTSVDDSIISITKIAKAISAYEQSFSITSSKFDRYIQGESSILNKQEKQGFNLFMGKAMCGTCHFAPLFNGLLPPYYDITEVESLGLTRNTNFTKPIADTDSGRYRFFPVEFYIGTFKTPTVRNVGKTAPYMHNGAFTTLQQVMEFYNKGGGNGIGLHNKYQTLSDKPLNLTPNEINQVIAFLQALTDKPLQEK